MMELIPFWFLQQHNYSESNYLDKTLRLTHLENFFGLAYMNSIHFDFCVITIP